MEVRRAQAAALTHDRANCKVSPRASNSKRHLGGIWAVLTAAEGPWHRALAPRSGGNKSVSRLIGSALERTSVLGVPAHGEVSLIRGRGMDARVELFRAPLGPRCGCRILAYGRRGCESGRRIAAIEHHARVVRRCPASVHRVGHVVGQRNRKECRARGGKRGLVAVARRRLPALLRLGWGLGGRRRGRALVARTDFSPLDNHRMRHA